MTGCLAQELLLFGGTVWTVCAQRDDSNKGRYGVALMICPCTARTDEPLYLRCRWFPALTRILTRETGLMHRRDCVHIAQRAAGS